MNQVAGAEMRLDGRNFELRPHIRRLGMSNAHRGNRGNEQQLLAETPMRHYFFPIRISILLGNFLTTGFDARTKV